MISIKGGLVKAGFRADNFGHRSYPQNLCDNPRLSTHFNFDSRINPA
jgi:hypothetical protein